MYFKDRTSTNKFEVEYLVGYCCRRMEGFLVLEKKFILFLYIKFLLECVGFIFE